VNIQVPITCDVGIFVNCNRIAMGTHGRGARADLMTGSTTAEVVHLGRMPALLVK
jgi:nucleotide-binding universal stress UspA family protein